MEIRKRSQKAVAKRHDLNYFKKGSPIRHWQWKLALGAIAASVVWIAVVALSHGRELLSKGPISSSHAVFGAKCEACHVPMQSGLLQQAGFRRHALDAACQSCHQVPDHQAKMALAPFSTPECGSCHVEHTGSMMLANTSDRRCIGCHEDLKSSHYASRIHSFVDGHPQFAPLRSGYEDDQKIKFNHQAHLQQGLRGPQGLVNLNCADCHRTPAAMTQTPWRFGSGAHLQQTSFEMTPASGPDPLHPTDNRAYMAPIAYAANCHDCHTLRFEKRIQDEAPHSAPAEVRAFIREKLRAFAAQNPAVVAAEIRNWANEPAAKVPAYRPMPPPRNPEEWIAVRSRQAERRIWYQSCNLCHSMRIPDDSPTLVAASLRSVQISSLTVHTLTLASVPLDSLTLPTVAPTNQKARWFTNAFFSHQAHIAVSCDSCHSRTRISNQGDDILLPGIASCQKCHDGQSSAQGPTLTPGHAESSCFLCHQYHDWSHPKTDPVVPHDLEFKDISELQPAAVATQRASDALGRQTARIIHEVFDSTDRAEH
jgi:predicted CXXCH cytochrome family protein